MVCRLSSGYMSPKHFLMSMLSNIFSHVASGIEGFYHHDAGSVVDSVLI